MNIVILAAGQGKRMKSALPKVLQTLAGKPLLQHVLITSLSLQNKQTKAGPIVVVGHGAADVKAFLVTISKGTLVLAKSVLSFRQNKRVQVMHSCRRFQSWMCKSLPWFCMAMYR
jgi:bifunctional N-acetylglucosamine-1-phosphate-uridyltransferase/glucosamine-1-phosphate-acetyltransferase GlmU-like protein